MKTLFLITVLFVLLAFAFKHPQQSTWEFSRDVFSDIAEKVSAGERERSTPEHGGNTRRHTDSPDNNIHQPIVENRNPGQDADKDTQNPTKERPIPPPPVEKPQLAETRPKPSKPLPKAEIVQGPKLPAHPVEEVATETFQKSRPETQNKTSSRPFGISQKEENANLAEIGARLDRASRLLSEVK